MTPFDLWWAELPPQMKRGKEQARANWAKCSKQHVGMLLRWKTEAEMGAFFVKAIQDQLATDHFKISSGQRAFPHGGTWISAGRYDDALGRPVPCPDVDADGNVLSDAAVEVVLAQHEEAVARARAERVKAAGRYQQSVDPSADEARAWARAAIERIRAQKINPKGKS